MTVDERLRFRGVGRYHASMQVLYHVQDIRRKICHNETDGKQTSQIAGEIATNPFSRQIMKPALVSLLAALALATSSTRAEITDDFSAGGWRRFSSTPGEMSIEPGKMRLVDAPGQPEWITASKTFTVDFEKTPFCLVKVADVSDSGTVKLIRKEPYDKRVAINIDRPGLYAVDMRSRFAWNGVGRLAIEAVLARDYPLIQGFILFFATVVALAAVVVDVAYAFLDPRIRYS